MIIIAKYRDQKFECLIDEEDLELVSGYGWRVNKYGYVRVSKYTGIVDGRETRREIQIHRLIMDAPEGFEVDHINGNPLDNRKENLRLCTRIQNKANTRVVNTNTTGYKGVSRHKGKWQASIRSEGRLIYLGRYDTPELAAQAYNDKAFELWADFAWLNPIKED